jgi:hypothetical protein
MVLFVTNPFSILMILKQRGRHPTNCGENGQKDCTQEEENGAETKLDHRWLDGRFWTPKILGEEEHTIRNQPEYRNDEEYPEEIPAPCVVQ